MALDDALWVKDLKIILFSITRAMKDRASVTNNGELLLVEYPNGRNVCFDCKIKTKQGFVMAAIIRPMGQMTL